MSHDITCHVACSVVNHISYHTISHHIISSYHITYHIISLAPPQTMASPTHCAGKKHSLPPSQLYHMTYIMPVCYFTRSASHIADCVVNHIIPCIISCHIISCHIISHHIISYHTISYATISYHIIPHHII